VERLCEIEVNLKDLPPDAFQKATGPEGVFYSVSYDLVIIFAPVIEFKMLYNGQEVGKVMTTYV
jgi:hypothetical protein